MSNDPITIPKFEELPKSMDYKFLKRQGIDHAQKLSGDIWTDYNEHDPGVTILENLCYVLSELGYKTNFSVEDLFYSKNGEAFDTNKSALYAPEDIFPCTPLTILDYRKLIIDNVSFVQNAWVIPVSQCKLGIDITGLYKVMLQADYRDTQTEEERNKVRDEVLRDTKNLLNKYRNICEDIDHIELLESEKISIAANISISANSIGESVLANIVFALSESLTPQIRFETLDELLEQGKSLDQVFDGPPPVHGFVNTEDLENSEIHILNTIHKSRLIKIISGVEGVNKVTNFKVLVNGAEVKGEIVKLPENRFPELDVEEMFKTNEEDDKNNGINLMIEDEITYMADIDTTRYEFEMLIARFKQRYLRPLDIDFPEPNSEKNVEDIQFFFPAQNSFPKAYGVGEFGLPVSASEPRKAQARQLKAYLMFFEQIMNNYLAQLVNVRHLFSLDEKVNSTYFSKNLFHIPNVNDLLAVPEEDFEVRLDGLTKRFDPFLKRRNKFLDHMLARFGEEFMTDSYNTLNKQASSLSGKEFQYEVIAAKTKFLQNYVEMSKNRGRGLDHSKNSLDSENVSGLKKRISLIFNINDYRNRILSGISNDPNMTPSKSKAGGPIKKKLKENIFRFTSGDKNITSEVLTYGLNRDLYEIRKAKDNKNYNVLFQMPNKDAEIIFISNNEIECEKAVSRLIEYLKKVNQDSEGFHLVEHILLRPVVDPKIGFYISNATNKLLQTDSMFTDEKADKKLFVKQLEEFGGVEKNYSFDKKGKGYIIYLKDKTGKLIAYNDGFLIENSVKKTIKETAKFIKKLGAERNGLNRQIQSEDPIIKGAMLPDDPYSLQLSAIVPSWPVRFQNKKLRTVFENIMKLNAPAHMALNCHWIGIEEMKEFETVYQAWLKEKSSDETNHSKLDSLSYLLLMLLKNYEDPQQPIVLAELPKLRANLKSVIKS